MWECGKLFVETYGLEMHMKVVHQKMTQDNSPGMGEDQIFPTNATAAKDLYGNGHVEKHQQVYPKEQPFQCSMVSCGKRFSIRPNLLVHERLHTYNYPYLCSVEGCSECKQL